MVTKTSIDETLEIALRQMVVNATSNDEYNAGIQFQNHDMKCFSMISMGDYGIVYDSTHDRLIVVWGLHIRDNRQGDWGQGYYFDNNGGNDLNSRYQIKEVIRLLLDKVQRV